MRHPLFVVLASTMIAAPLAAAPATTTTPQELRWSMTSEHGRLGVMVMSLTTELRQHFGAPPDRGLLVARVEPGSAAARAGVTVGDVITTVDGHPVRDALEVISAIAPVAKGATVTLDLVRNGRPVRLAATMADEPMHAGASARAFDDELKQMLPEMRRWFRDMLRDTPGLDQWQHSAAPSHKS